MGLKAALSKPYARWIKKKINQWAEKPLETQDKVFHHLISKAENTVFGKDHDFSQIKNYEDFKKRVPIREYEGLKHYIERIVNGEEDILWPGKPIYLCKTSGTTSGAKYIPLTKQSMPNHIHSARNAILCYIAETGKADFVDGKMIFLQGSPELNKKGSIPLGRLSGIVANHVPAYLQKNRMPSYKTNCIDDWEKKVDEICHETLSENMTLISGIPSWVQMYFERLIEISGKESIKDIFPNFNLFIYGGVNLAPYRANFDKLVGKEVDTIELYPASEGFIAFQDSQKEEGMLLVLNKGIFYEFIPASEYFNEHPTRLKINEVELGVNYAIILNTNAGLWGYSIGDTVKFVSKKPYRIIVSGRIKHFTSAFGEHVIAEEVESTMKKALEAFPCRVAEFHLAPEVNPKEGLPFHEWLIEFEKEPENLNAFAAFIDQEMQKKNIYYKDLITGAVLKPAVIRSIPLGSFKEYMKSQGKLGGQNKIPRLANDRKIADAILK